MVMNISRDELSAILETARIAIEKTNTTLMRGWQTSKNLAYTSKGDLSPVTEIDRKIEKQIQDIVLKRHPTHRLVGEEYGTVGNETSPYVWFVDPIDGTKNYIRGLSQFATQVAVMYMDTLIVGVSSAPVLNEMIFASKGAGAYLNGVRIQVSDTDNLKHSYISHGSIKHFSRHDRLDQLVGVCERSWCNRGFGDFWSYHMLATGHIDAVLEAQTKIWDIAAVSLIVEEAGGRVTDFDGSPISSDTTSVIAANKLIHEEIMNIIQTR
jgi:histidinol-phosphatase